MRKERLINRGIYDLATAYKARYIKCRNGILRYNFIAYASKVSIKAFRTKIKKMELHKTIGCKIDILAESPMVRGLLCIERRLVKWAMCKYKNNCGRSRRIEDWLYILRKQEAYTICLL